MRLPNFFDALKSIWLLTWKSQWTWSRFLSRAGALLVLPALVLLTVVGPEKWAQRRIDFGNPPAQVNSFSRRLERRKISIEPAQQENLTKILREEYSRAQGAWHEDLGESAEDRRARLKSLADDSGDKILDRATGVLDDSQMTEFRTWEARSRASLIARLNSMPTPWSRSAPFYHWLIDFYFFIILPLTCVRGCGPLIRDELQADTLGFLVTRPVTRARLLIVKYISQTAWLELLLLAETLLLFAVGAMRQIPALGELIPLLLVVQILAIPAWGALGVLLGQITARYMPAALIYGAVVEMGIGRIPTNINTLSLLRHIETLLSHNKALQDTFSWDAGPTWLAILALILAPLIFLGVAALLFSLIEYHAAGEMQK
jgi:hypothetical protein